MTIRMVIADDHPLIIDALSHLFAADPEFQVLACCADGGEALRKVRELRPDILLLDRRMPGKDGLEVARQLQQEGLPTRVVLLTAELDEDRFMEALQAGVQGVILKEMSPELLLQCVRKVHGGGQWLQGDLAGSALEMMVQREAGMRELKGVLTQREIELVRMIAQGLSNREIAGRLFISEGTVKVHLHNIYEKLGISGRLKLLRYAQDKGLV